MKMRLICKQLKASNTTSTTRQEKQEIENLEILDILLQELENDSDYLEIKVLEYQPPGI